MRDLKMPRLFNSSHAFIPARRARPYSENFQNTPRDERPTDHPETKAPAKRRELNPYLKNQNPRNRNETAATCARALPSGIGMSGNMFSTLYLTGLKIF